MEVNFVGKLFSGFAAFVREAKLDLVSGFHKSKAWCFTVASLVIEISIRTFRNVHLWVHFYWSWVFWHPQILSDLARCVGVPLKIHDTIMDGEFGHYAPVLVDVDLSSHFPESISLNRKCGSTFINLFYDNISEFL